ncbi:MAG: class I SAM-dependent methyltransferase [Chloroflexi bacterium]|nr:MAG: class I SAM-dependent methyltransferase [Chloroflexota bacterium]TMD73402.1 MAG: class I SAM-dependent methyltransferase [Chloroflexota bacterium]
MPALERLYLGSGLHIQEELHLGRYRFACSRIGADATVLDAACGSGYGSGILAQHARRVVAVDLSLDALAHARAHYPLPNIEFVRADLSEPIALPDCSCDAIVSFETLEHVRNQRVMLSEFRRILKPGGTLVLSSPDRDIITGKAHEINEFHVAELSKLEFVELIGEYFRLQELYGQMRYEVSTWKSTARRLAKRDVFGLRRRVRSWRVGAFMVRMLAPSHRVLEAVSPNTPGEHWWLIAVAVKS